MLCHTCTLKSCEFVEYLRESRVIQYGVLYKIVRVNMLQTLSFSFRNCSISSESREHSLELRGILQC